ncbi:unnamed protein product [Hapterophycus canaliculatus]
MQRLSKLILKSHGACRLYLARLRDALFMVRSEDLAGVEAALLLLGHSQEDIDNKKKIDWPSFLRSYRVVAQPAELLERFDLVNRINGRLLDKKTK